MNAPSNEALSLTSVTKIFSTSLFRKKTAVSDLTFGVRSGEALGLLGANGSGKSTTIKMILGFLQPSGGEILIQGQSAATKNVRALIGYLPENPRFQKFLTAEQVIHYYGGLLSMRGAVLAKRTEELLEKVNLLNVRRERVKGFSKGMTQRLAIAQALLSRPPILIFDEPMSGLDPLGRIEMRKLIQQILSDAPNTTLFFSTHVLTDVEQICSSVLVLKHGVLNRQCSVRELLESENERYEIQIREGKNKVENEWLKKRLFTHSNFRTVVVAEGVDELRQGLATLYESGMGIVGISSQRKNLEEALFTEKDLPSSALEAR